MPQASKKLTDLAPFKVGDFTVDPSSLRISSEKGEKRLETKVMQVLIYLAEHAGKVVSRTKLEAHVWPGRVLTEDALTNTILKLRRAFGDNARESKVIETIPKTGYRLIARVDENNKPVGQVTPISIEEQNENNRLKVETKIALLQRYKFSVIAMLFFLFAILVISFSVYLDDQYSISINHPEFKPKVAILPLKNQGEQPEQDYLANGFTTDIITDLSKVSGLIIIIPDTDDINKINADYILSGNLQRSDDQLRVNVQLIKKEEDQQHVLWGERYTGKMTDVFNIQDELASGVLRSLKVKLLPTELSLVSKRDTKNSTAYDFYLRGIEAHGHRTKEQNQEARADFEAAIRLDQGFVRAYNGLALTHSRDAIDGWTSTPSESLEIASELSQQAIHLDPSLPQVYFVRGQVELFRRRYNTALRAVENAIKINPDYADAKALKAWILNYTGDSEQAIVAMNDALRINTSPSGSYFEVLGEIQFVQKQYHNSIETFQMVLERNPNYTRARMWLAAALALNGDIDQAKWEAVELLVLAPEFSLRRLAFSLPFKDPLELEAMLKGLKRAGLTK